MNIEGKHPSPREWLDWIAAGEPDPGFLAHERACPGCREQAAVLRRVHAAKSAGRWRGPSPEARRRATSLFGELPPPPPPEGRGVQPVAWPAPSDVRSGSLLAAGEARTASHFFPEAEVTVTATPPASGTEWSLAGRVWLTQPTSEPIRVEWVHEDHVLQTTEITSGGFFAFEEAVPSGWRLEIHLPAGPTLVVGEPDR